MKKATREQTKEHNKKLILNTVYVQGEMSRADIARLTKLTRATVSSIVSELIDDGLIDEIGQGKSLGGKRPIILKVLGNSRQLIGIDLADNEFRGGIVDLNGVIVNRVKIPVNDKSGKAALNLVYNLIDSLVATSTSPLLGIGIGTPGLIDAHEGKVRSAINLDWQDLPLRKILKDRYNLNVYMANDCQVAALGEYTFNYRGTIPNLIVVKVGRGIGAGIVINGKLYQGDDFGAGEIGHIGIKENGLQCVCGNRGCLETIVSNKAVLNYAVELAQNNPESSLHQFSNSKNRIDYNSVVKSFNAGDDEIQAFIHDIGRCIGITLANMVGILNIHNISIAGMICNFGNDLLTSIQQEINKRSMPILNRNTRVVFSNMGEDIIIRGAAALLMINEL
ncbi:MAG: ROK family transcriptional regulator [Desulfobacterales bacterium]|nr:ROK family transcriptional regulator [Desulfobacterales bacterium]